MIHNKVNERTLLQAGKRFDSLDRDPPVEWIDGGPPGTPVEVNDRGYGSSRLNRVDDRSTTLSHPEQGCRLLDIMLVGNIKQGYRRCSLQYYQAHRLCCRPGGRRSYGACPGR